MQKRDEMRKPSLRSAFRVHRSAFTLTEILIVMGLIILLIALAVPAFNLITGARSVDAGENLLAAMMSRARAEAVRTHQVAGLAIYYDYNKERTALALVSGPQSAVIRLVYNSAAGKRVTTGFVCLKTHTATAANGPPDQNPPPTSTALWQPVALDDSSQTVIQIDSARDRPSSSEPAGLNEYHGWRAIDDNGNAIQYFADADASNQIFDIQYLPKGVGAQTINDPNPTGAVSPASFCDRYLRAGVILFDGDGNLIHRTYQINVPAPTDLDTTHLFRLMGFDQRPAPLNTAAVGVKIQIYSQLGVVLYDEQNFHNNAGGARPNYPSDPLTDGQVMTSLSPAQVEETWLDSNCLSLMINRYDGSLIRGE